VGRLAGGRGGCCPRLAPSPALQPPWVTLAGLIPLLYLTTAGLISGGQVQRAVILQQSLSPCAALPTASPNCNSALTMPVLYSGETSLKFDNTYARLDLTLRRTYA